MTRLHFTKNAAGTHAGAESSRFPVRFRARSRTIVALFTVAVVAATSVHSNAHANGYAPAFDLPTPVMVIGDSILDAVQPTLEAEFPLWAFDTVSSRDPYPVSVPGTDAAIAGLPVIAPGGWLVFQEHAGSATNAEYRVFIRGVVDQLPPGRCLAFVAGFRVNSQRSLAQATIMGQEIVRAPCRHLIRWDLAAAANPSLVSADGLHPSPAGVAWLAAAIENAVT